MTSSCVGPMPPDVKTKPEGPTRCFMESTVAAISSRLSGMNSTRIKSTPRLQHDSNSNSKVTYNQALRYWALHVTSRQIVCSQFEFACRQALLACGGAGQAMACLCLGYSRQEARHQSLRGRL